MVWRYENRRMPSTARRATVMGTTMAKMPMAVAFMRTLRISSVAYADDDRLSLAKTARAVGLPKRSWMRRSVERGLPTITRLMRREVGGTGGRAGSGGGAGNTR